MNPRRALRLWAVVLLVLGGALAAPACSPLATQAQGVQTACHATMVQNQPQIDALAGNHESATQAETDFEQGCRDALLDLLNETPAQLAALHDAGAHDE